MKHEVLKKSLMTLTTVIALQTVSADSSRQWAMDEVLLQLQEVRRDIKSLNTRVKILENDNILLKQQANKKSKKQNKVVKLSGKNLLGDS